MTSQKLTAALFGLMILLLGVGNAAAQARDEVFLPVRQGEKWGFIDRTGKERIKPVFDDAVDFGCDYRKLGPRTTGFFEGCGFPSAGYAGDG